MGNNKKPTLSKITVNMKSFIYALGLVAVSALKLKEGGDPPPPEGPPEHPDFKAMAEHAATEMFGHLDTDEDGKLTEQEAKDALMKAVDEGHIDGEFAGEVGEHLYAAAKIDGIHDELTFEEACMYLEGMIAMDYSYNMAADEMTDNIFKYGDTNGDEVITRAEAEPVIMEAVGTGQLDERQVQVIVDILESADKRGGEDDSATRHEVREAAYDFFAHTGELW